MIKLTRYVAKQHSEKKNDLSKKLLMTSIGTITLISTASILTTPVKADVVTDTATNTADATSPTSSINESKITTRSTNDTTDESNSIKTTNDQSNLGTSGTNDISKEDSTGDNTSRQNENVITKDTNNPTKDTNVSLSDNSDAPSQAKVNQSNSQKATSITSTNNSSNQVNQSKIKNVDAGVWMPDQTLRKFIENQISENPQTPANDTNLWSYINTPIFSQLTNGVEHNSDGMTSLEGLQYATYLNTVELSNTSLMSNGDGLSALTQMPNLSFLSLKNDPSINMSLSNFVNKYISNDTKLMNFTLNTMNVTGSIPDFSNYKKLNNLTLTNLKLTGNIPDFSANTNLSILILAHNQLSGSLPDLSANTSLSDLRINNNLLSGKLPDLTKNPLDRIFLYGRL